jgi:hypothetical protein
LQVAAEAVDQAVVVELADFFIHRVYQFQQETTLL